MKFDEPMLPINLFFSDSMVTTSVRNVPVARPGDSERGTRFNNSGGKA